MTTVQPMHQEKRSKWRLSNLVKPGHSKDSKDDLKDNNSGVPHDNGLLGPDSAYGGSDTMNSTSSNSADNVPTITRAQASAQNAPTRTHIDGQTGKTITTTTTTTTTTVTTINGDHVLVPAGEEVVVSREEVPTELSARPLSQVSDEDHQRQGGSPPIPVKDNRRRSKSPLVQNGNRLSNGEPVMSVSPNHQNFSYPARTPPPQSYEPVSPQGGRSSYASDMHMPPPIPSGAQGNRLSYGSDSGMQSQGQHEQYQQYRNPSIPQNISRPRPPVEPSQGQPRLNGEPPRNPNHLPYNREGGAQPSTLQSLKIAAAGIHGAGETLRGALNTTLDRHTGASAESMAANNAVLERGRQEIETGQFHHASVPVNELDETMMPQEPQKKSRGLRNVLRKKSRSTDGLNPVME